MHPHRHSPDFRTSGLRSRHCVSDCVFSILPGGLAARAEQPRGRKQAANEEYKSLSIDVFEADSSRPTDRLAEANTRKWSNQLEFPLTMRVA